ncbi:MAG TPA: hypothetical protein PKH54_01680 [Myxococcota bacterium]|nr:hypothetical protein [Myxococcota bacterium]HOC98626.1 hypothetical protein [Myxococcota bacterium]HOH75891.1 hypothetical protein [Myxococcota bacterium]
MMERFFQSKRGVVVAVALVMASCLFRLWFVPDARLAGDEATQYSTAMQVADLKLFPVKGVNMTGDAAMTPGGLYHLIMSIPFFFTDDPRGAGVFLVLLNCASMLFGWFILRREFGGVAATFGLIISLFNPFSVFFSDRQWNPNLLVPLGWLWIWLLLSAFRGEGRFRWGWLATLLVVSPQIHMSCPHLTIMTVVMMAVFRPRIRPLQIAGGTAIGMATYVPYLAVDAYNGWSNTTRILNQLSEAAAPWYEAFRGGLYQLLYAGGDYTYFLGKGFWFPMTEWGFLGSGGSTAYSTLLGFPSWPGYPALALLCAALAVAAAAHAFVLLDAVRRGSRGVTAFIRSEPLTVLAILNIPVLILLMLKTSKPFYPHYSMVLFPLAIVPVAAAVSRLGRSRTLVAGLMVLAAAIALNQAILTARYYRAEESKASVHLVVEASRTILADAGPSSFRLVFDMPGTRMGTWPFATVARVLHKAEWRERKDGTRLTYVIAPPGSRHEARAARIWDIDGKRLIRKEDPK